MLAAGSAWRILAAEHTRLRHLLVGIKRTVEDGAWQRPGPQLNLLQRRIQEFQHFETQTHRPKGHVLLDSVRGRSAEADLLLDALEQESRECEQLLIRVARLLAALDEGGDADSGEVGSLLTQHGESMMRQLDREDTALRAYTAQLLTSEEWSAVVSSISREVRKARPRTPKTG